MKKLIFMLVLLISVSSFSQKQPLYGEVSTSMFITNYAESGVNLDIGVFKLNAKWFPSFNMDVFTANEPFDKRWTTVQTGLRINIPLSCKFLVAFGPKYTTQGVEKVNGYNHFVFDGAVTYLYTLFQREKDMLLFKASAQYNNTPDKRIFVMAGLQFILK